MYSLPFRWSAFLHKQERTDLEPTDTGSTSAVRASLHPGNLNGIRCFSSRTASPLGHHHAEQPNATTTLGPDRPSPIAIINQYTGIRSNRCLPAPWLLLLPGNSIMQRQEDRHDRHCSNFTGSSSSMARQMPPSIATMASRAATMTTMTTTTITTLMTRCSLMASERDLFLSRKSIHLFLSFSIGLDDELHYTLGTVC